MRRNSAGSSDRYWLDRPKERSLESRNHYIESDPTPEAELLRAQNRKMASLKYLTLAVCLASRASAMGITRRLDGSACADEPGATLPGGWDCARIAEYIAGSDVWAPMEVVIALFIFVTCAFSMTRLCRAKEDQYAPVTRAISEEDLVAPEDDVERGPTLEDKRRMLD